MGIMYLTPYRGLRAAQWGLIHNKWIEKDAEATHEYVRSAYKITQAGIKAAGKRAPVMRVKWHGAHGIRWA